MPAMRPVVPEIVPEIMPRPGYFMLNLGVIGLLAFVMLHMIYGAIVAA